MGSTTVVKLNIKISIKETKRFLYTVHQRILAPCSFPVDDFILYTDDVNRISLIANIRKRIMKQNIIIILL